MESLHINGLDAWYHPEKKVLNELFLSLQMNEAVGLIGLNGAGKTTFIKAISGLHIGYSVKEAKWNGQNISFRDKSFKTERYTVFAEDESFQYFTFREYLSYVFSAYRKKPIDVRELVQGFHFEKYENTLIKDLSTGNKKKVYLMTAFALSPKLLFMDEPVNGLDFQSTEYLYSLINDYKQFGTVLFSTHVLESVCMTADRVLVLENGAISRTFAKEQIDAEQIREALHYDGNI